MRKTIVFLSIVFLLWGVSVAQVDPFYLQAFEAGKKLVQQKYYDAAIERLEVAEFGLMEKQDALQEIYFYVSLAYYKLERFDEVRKTLKKLKNITGVIDPASHDFPESIGQDIHKMLTELNYISSSTPVKPVKKTKSDKKSTEASPPATEVSPPAESTSQVLGFDHVRELILSKDLKEGARQLKRLKKKYRKDPRVSLLEGLLLFHQEHYSEVIQMLLGIYGELDGEHRDEASYYLSLSYYFEKNYGQALAFYQKIVNARNKKQLSSIYNKIVTGRQADIDRLATNFSIGELEKLVARYSGDQFLCESIFQRILELRKSGDPSIEPVIYGCLRFPAAVNGNFVAAAARYFEGAGKAETAVKILAKYLANRPLDENDAEAYFQLGKLYLSQSSSERALKEFSVVIKLNPDHREAQKYIDELNRNKNRSKYRSDE